MTGFLDSPTTDVEPFWLAVTNTTPSPRRHDDVFVTLLPADGDAYLRAQVTGCPPRVHLDLHVPRVASAAAEAVALGARTVLEEEGLVVLVSPAGLEFCLVTWDGETVRPRPVTWHGGQTSEVDQISLDVPSPRYDAEARFWQELTGWPVRATDLPEFAYLERPAGMPLRLLLQRTGSAHAGMHVDLACDDVAAEVDRHVSLGARVVREVPGDWTTLRDPAGREYCVTARHPAR